MSEKKQEELIERVENSLLSMLLAQIKQQEVIEALLQHAKEPSLFQGSWEDVEKTAESVKSNIIKAIQNIVPEGKDG